MKPRGITYYHNTITTMFVTFLPRDDRGNVQYILSAPSSKAKRIPRSFFRLPTSAKEGTFAEMDKAVFFCGGGMPGKSKGESNTFINANTKDCISNVGRERESYKIHFT